MPFRRETLRYGRLESTDGRRPSVAGGRNVRRLLANVSKAGHATLVTLSSGTYADGSVFIRIDDNAAGIPSRVENAAPVTNDKLYQFIIIDHRLAQLGGELVIGDESSSAATIVLPDGLVVDQH